MCRRFQLHALVLLAFGAGMLLGCCFDSGFIRLIIGLGAIAFGLFLLQKR